MTLIYYKLCAATLILLVSVLSIIPPMRKQRALQDVETLHLGEALASGIFLGVAFFHMLPDAIIHFAEAYPHIHYPIPEVIAMGGFLLMLFLERLAILKPNFYSYNTIPYILTLILIIHSLTEGGALGIGDTYSETLMLFIAIMAHKGSASFALCVTLLRHKISVRITLLMMLCFALMTPIGIGIGTIVHHGDGELVKSLFNAFAAGTFLYISTLHHSHKHNHQGAKQSLAEFMMLLVGVVAMGVIAIWT